MIFMGNHRYFQIFVANFLTTFVIIYNGLAEPYEDRANNFFQNFNECFIFFFIYFMICFADFILEQ